MGEQEVYEIVDFAAKEDLLRWLELDYTQGNTAHHLRNQVRLLQPPALTTPGSHNPRLSQPPALTTPGSHNPRLLQPPALTTPGSHTPGSCSSVKDDIRRGEKISWEAAGV